LSAAIELLTAAQREVIRLLKIEGYSVAEIAEKTGRSRASVKVTAHRGYKALRRLLEGS
jgi:RNA polymerase sigma-70 factor (ECF subfamily)